MCFVRLSEQTAIIFLYSINRLVFVTDVESVYCAVRTESLYKQIRFVFKGLRGPLRHKVSQNLRATNWKVKNAQMSAPIVKYQIRCRRHSAFLLPWAYTMNLSRQSWTAQYRSWYMTSRCASCINQRTHYGVKHIIPVDASSLTVQYSLSMWHTVVPLY
jgi:hypothetical protein